MPRNSKKFKIKRKLPSVIAVFIIILSLVVIYFVFQGQEAKAEWFNDNWMYRKSISISYSGNETLTEYQILIDGLNTATFISDGKMQSDCDDIRFTGQGGNLLHYSIIGNTCNTSDTKIWVKTNEISSNGATIFLYYGNPSVQSYQSESKTFSYSNEKTIGYVLHSVVDDLQIISLEEDNSITHNSVTRTLGKYETSSFTSISQWGPINAKKLFNADDSSGNTDLFVPVSWAGTEFYFYSRDTAETLYLWMLAPWQDATVTVYADGIAITGCTSISVTSSGSDTACSNVDAGAIRVSSNYPILVFTQPTNSDDQMPVHPATSQKWLGGGSSSVVENGNAVLDYRYYYDTTADEQDPADASANINTSLSGDSSYGGGGILVRSANSQYNYGIHQYGDGDGGDAHYFNDETEQGTRFGSANQADYISVASTQDATCSVYNVGSSSPIATQSLTSSNTSIYHYGFNTATSTIYTSGAWYMECDEPVVAHYQKATDSESNLMHYPMMRQFTYPIPSVGNPGDEEQSPGPVAYWKFDEGYGTTAQDSTSNDLDGAMNDLSWKPESECVSGKCVYGGTGYFSKSNDPKLNFGTGSFTISFWGKPIDYTYPKSFFPMHKGNACYQDGVAGWCSSSYSATGINMSFNDGTNKVSTTLTLNVGSRPPDLINKWTHIAYVFDRTAGRIYAYINGVRQNNSVNISSVTGSVSNSETLRFGNNAGWQTHGFIDEVKIYPYARSVAEIKADYLSGSAGAGGSASSAVLGGKPQKWLSDGLVGYWKMDESSWGTPNCSDEVVLDSSGNDNSGKACPATTGPTGAAAGKFGNAGDFDGSDDYIDCGNDESLNFTSENFSIEAWIKLKGETSDDMIFDKGLWENCGYSVRSSNRNIYIYTFQSGALQVTKTANNQLPIDSWVHIALVRIGTIITIYKNGVDITFIHGSHTDPATCTTIGKIGGYTASQYTLNGLIDEVRIYNRALSPKEVRDIYNWAPGPVGYWKMDEASWNGASGEVKDSSTYGNNGTRGGNATTYSPGKFGKTGTYDGTGDYILIPATADFDVQGLTISSWNYSDNYDANMFMFEKTTDGSVNTQYSLFYSSGGNNNRIIFRTYGLSVTDLVITDHASGPVDSQWNHIVGTYNPSTGTKKIYCNGVEIVSATGLTGTLTTNPAGTSWIGTYGGGSGYPFNGFIDETKIYNYARTQKQIVEDMNAGHPAVGSPVGSALLYLKLDEGYSTAAYDFGYNGDEGVLTDGPSWINSGKFGKGIDLDGLNDRVQGFVSNPFEYTGDGLTLSIWVNQDSGETTVAHIISKPWNGSGQYNYMLKLNSNDTLSFYLLGSSSWETVTTDTLSTDTWTHLAVTVEGATSAVKIYKDGKVIKSDTHNITGWTPSSGDSNVSLCIGSLYPYGGGWGGNTGFSFDGKIDEVKIYNFALTQDEIKLDYNRGAAVLLGAVSTDSSGNPDWSSEREYCIPGDTGSCSAPVAEWKFDEKTGIYAYDTSENNYTGAFQNSPSWTIGKYGSSLDFNNSDWVSTTLDIYDLYTGGAFTVEAWSYDTAISSYDTIASSFKSSPYDGFFLRRSTDGVTMSCCIYNDGTGNCASTSAEQNVWIHWACTYSSNVLKLYKNGVYKSQDASASMTDPANTFKIGANYESSENWEGKIDSVKVYNYARTQAQIAWDYNRGGPVGWWKLDENQGMTAYDASGNSNNGTLESSMTSDDWVDGKYNTALDFDGGNDYVDCGNNVSLQISANITVSAWIKPNTIESWPTRGIIVDKSSGLTGFRLFVSSNTSLFFLIYDGVDFIQSAATISIGEWSHVVGVYDGTDAILYINGVEKDRDPQDGLAAETSQILAIGSDNDGGTGGPFDGTIDEVRIYNYALTEEQIKNVMNQGAAIRFGPN